MQDRKRQTAVFALMMGLILAFSLPSFATQPVPFGRLTSMPGWRKDPFGSGRLMYHRGYDIAVPIGTPVNPTQDGIVSYAGPYKGYGNLVAVDHGNGYVTLYGHLSRILVSVGTPVTTNTLIALSGNTGRSTGAHLHYEIRAYPGAQMPKDVERGEESRDHEEDWVEAQLATGHSKQLAESDGWYHGIE
ncbi:hypothetical protein A2G06_16715 (plasmid) [Geobacter anodireducens]|nr:hypothetical protein A2G06_16715 [Geobacter anodireducens]